MHILLVEDDVALAAFLKRGMEQQGYRVTHAPHGEAGVEIAAEHMCDVIVLDLNLPRLDGVEVLRRMRLGGVQTPVLVLTGRGSVEERIRCLDAGADDFLVKPFSFHEMVARCRAIARRKGAEAETTVVRHGALRIDRLSRTVHLREMEVILTGKEFALLDYLLQNRNRPVSRPELLEKVWKMVPGSGTNVVDVYVNYLRRKLRMDDAEADLIVTVRGSGYCLAPASAAARKPVQSETLAGSFPLLMPPKQNYPMVAA